MENMYLSVILGKKSKVTNEIYNGFMRINLLAIILAILCSLAIVIQCTPAIAMSVHFSWGVNDPPTAHSGTYGAQKVGFSIMNQSSTLNLSGGVSGTNTQIDVGDRLFLQLDTVKDYGSLGAGDDFVFYINSHAGFMNVGNEPEVQAHAVINGQITRIPTTGNEYFYFGNRIITDDAFTSYFDDPLWNSVNKLFIIDTCYAGGFWSGDLSRLPRSAIIAASSEADVSYAAIDPDTGYLTGLLGQSVASIISSYPQTLFQFDTFAVLVEQEYTGSLFTAGLASIQNFRSDIWGTEVNPSDLGGPSLFYERTDDYGSPIPEPSTILLLGFGIAGLVFYRRKYV